MGVQFGYSFPAIRGVQARREYFVSMCPMRMLPKIFLFNEDEIAPEIRAQRRLNTSRVPALASYITSNRDSFAFSAITASLDGEVQFAPISQEGDARNIGILSVSMDTKFIINDGQHRRAAIERAMSESPDIGDESIAVVFFHDRGLKRCQQLFSDLNRYAIRPANSLNILYDHRDARALLAKNLVGDNGVFTGLVELEKSTLSPRSRRLFTLSAVYNATNDLLQGRGEMSAEQSVKLATNFWIVVKKQIKEWRQVQAGKMTAGEVRQDFIHSHAIALQAIGRVGCVLLQEYPEQWSKKMSPLSKIDWRRANTKVWAGRALLAGRVSKGMQNMTLTTNFLKHKFGVALSPEEQRVETAFTEKKK